MENQHRNIKVVHSVWRRIKKGKIHDLKVHDLEPRKDIKGGRSSGDKPTSVTGDSKGTTHRQ